MRDINLVFENKVVSTAKLNDSETEGLLALSGDESNLAVAAFKCSLYLEVSLRVVCSPYRETSRI